RSSRSTSSAPACRRARRAERYAGSGLAVYVREGEHGEETLLLRVVETARAPELGRVLVRSEENVPPHEVAVVVPVTLVLVVDAVHLGALEYEAHPARRPHVRVVEELADRGEERVDRAGFQREAQE